MVQRYCVYIIRAVNYPNQVYVGRTTDIKKRLYDHNSGTTASTKKYKPWKMITYLVFDDKTRSIEFEKYLKSGSGRAFREKRLL